MDKVLRPERLNLDPKLSADGRNTIAFSHWTKTMENYLKVLKSGQAPLTDEQMFNALINYISPEIYQTISSLATYTEAIAHLNTIFVKKTNENHARHSLATRIQQEGETIDQFYVTLCSLIKDCNFKAVTEQTHAEESVRTALIAGVKSDAIRQRLLEETVDLEKTLSLAKSVEGSIRNAASYQASSYNNRPSLNSLQSPQEGLLAAISESEHTLAAAYKPSPNSCGNCGKGRHPRNQCPARDSLCNNCSRKGHWGTVCRSKPKREIVNSLTMSGDSRHQSSEGHVNPYLATMTSNCYGYDPRHEPAMANSYPNHSGYLASISSSYPSALANSVVNVKVNNNCNAFALIDTGSTQSFISKSFVEKHNHPTTPFDSEITMASESHSCRTRGVCKLDLRIGDLDIGRAHLLVLEKLCCDIIIGHDVLSRHKGFTINFGGHLPKIELEGPPKVLALTIANIEPPPLFLNLTENVYPIACSSRKFSTPDAIFIKDTVKELCKSGVVRPSNSPWRAQVLITGNDSPHSKRRMVVDYSRTINRFTQLDAYPLPQIDTIVNALAQFELYSTFDLKSAYYQVPIRENEKQYTAFEAAGKLLEFNVIPFGVTNGVAAFQRVIDRIIESENLEGTLAYVDNITVAGNDQSEHDANVSKFLKATTKYGLTLNESKTVSSVKSLKLLGYCVSKNCIRPDPDRMQPLLDLPLPHDPASLQRALGFFSYYSRWVEKFSDRVRPLIDNPTFPLSDECSVAFQGIKRQISNSCVICPTETDLLVLETDASDFALSACLSQGGKPVAFFSRTLKSHERKHHAVEKEACAVVEAARKWNHYLVGRRFLLITDQQAVSYMFSSQNHGKVKNDKILRWRIELSALDFEIRYRPGPENVTADCLSRAYCSSLGSSSSHKSLQQLHEQLVHPGIVRLHHFVKTRNLPFSLDDVKRTIGQCRTCAEIKPRFFRPNNPPLVEATKPFDRLSIDFKGPIPSSGRNRYFLTMVDEYSRFSFAYPCQNMESSTVIRCLTDVFSTFGIPGFVHNDRGPSLVSEETRLFLLRNGISYSNSTKYNPRGNGQVERYNGVIWKSIQLALRDKNLPESRWEDVLPEVLHCQRTLLCTATNTTPHERIFSYQRRTASGESLPQWLLERGPVLVKRHVRPSKYVPAVSQVELIQANPSFAKIRYPCGREDSVSLRDLAPLPRASGTDTPENDSTPPPGPPVVPGKLAAKPAPYSGDTASHDAIVPDSSMPAPILEGPAKLPDPVDLPTLEAVENVPRRSTRTTKPIDRFQAGT